MVSLVISSPYSACMMKILYQSSLVGMPYHLRMCKALTTLIFSLKASFWHICYESLSDQLLTDCQDPLPRLADVNTTGANATHIADKIQMDLLRHLPPCQL